jgi:hypothetical protein
LFIHVPKQRVEIAPEPEYEPVREIPTPSELDDDVIEIDTDEYFVRDKTGKVQAPDAKKIDTTNLEDDLLYDLC